MTGNGPRRPSRVLPAGHSGRRATEGAIRLALLVSAGFSVLALGLIILFVIREGWPVLLRYGPLRLITGTDWSPGRGSFGMLPQLVGTVFVTLGSLIISIPVGIGCAVFLAELSRPWLAARMRPIIALLAAVPSVIYGFFGVTVVVPALRGIFGGTGYSLLAGAIILSLMTLPTIVSLSEDALRAVPRDYREASLALGSTGWQTIWRVLLPAARSGITVSIVLAMGRAIGETMAVMMVTGNRPLVARSLLQMGPTMAGTIGQEWGYAAGDHASALFALGTFLLIVIMLLNGLTQIVMRKGRGAQ